MSTSEAEGSQSQAYPTTNPGSPSHEAASQSHTDKQRAAQVASRLSRLTAAVDRKTAAAAKRCVAYEASLARLRRLLSEAAPAYANAVTQADRNHAFDGLTAELGRIRLATCSLVEAVGAWREARSNLRAAREEQAEIAASLAASVAAAQLARARGSTSSG